MKRSFIIAASLLFAAAAVCNAGGFRNKEKCTGYYHVDTGRLSRADTVIDRAISDGIIPGAVLAVVSNNSIVYMKAYGNKSLVPEKTPMTTGTMFDMASVSKCVGTTLSFMQLIDRGRVRLTDNVSMYIPGFKPWIDPETGEKVEITIRDLMTHSSGLTPYVNVASFVSKYGKNQPDTLMKVISTEVKRNFRPGTKFMYSCLNFITLQHVLENVTGERLCDYAQQNVFDALGLKHTCYNPSGANLELCAPTEVQPDGLPLKGVVHDPIARVINNGNSGNAGVFSNAEDLSTIAIALLNGGALPDGKGERILSQAAVKTMITIPSENAPCVGRALGWDVKSAHSGVKGDLFSRDKSICHTGYTGTSMVIDFETNTAVILLTNRVHPHDVGSVGRIRALVANIVAGSLTDSRGFNVK